MFHNLYYFYFFSYLLPLRTILRNRIRWNKFFDDLAEFSCLELPYQGTSAGILYVQRNLILTWLLGLNFL